MANGWTRGSTVYDLFNVTSATPATFFRFVALGLNTTGTLAGGGQIRILARPVALKVYRRLATGQVKANTKASDSASAQTPATTPFETAGIVEHRAVMEVVGISGPIKLQPSAQETNTPDDDTSWTSVGLLGTEVTAVGTTFPTVFVAVAYTKRYGRYVINAKNDTGGADVECATVRIIVEARG